jgi:cobalamin biosynthesis Mg chelatase CobN
METASGTPAAIKTWWYPGERTGYEFIYPKEQARRLATAASQPVLTTDAQTTTTEQTNTADLSRVASGGQETDVNASAAPTAATPTGNTQEGQVASSSLSIPTPSIPVVGSAPAVTQTASAQIASAHSGPAQPARSQLPRTATQLPLVAMVGTLALLSAATLWYWRTRVR